MIKLRVDWRQICENCGTEVVIDLLNHCPDNYACPWCGTMLYVDVVLDDPNVKDSLIETLNLMEAELNARFH